MEGSPTAAAAEGVGPAAARTVSSRMSPSSAASRRPVSLGRALHRTSGPRAWVARPASPGFASRRISRPVVTSPGRPDLAPLGFAWPGVPRRAGQSSCPSVGPRSARPGLVSLGRSSHRSIGSHITRPGLASPGRASCRSIGPRSARPGFASLSVARPGVPRRAGHSSCSSVGPRSARPGFVSLGRSSRRSVGPRIAGRASRRPVMPHCSGDCGKGGDTPNTKKIT